jgi:hypothetical protein
MPSLVDLLIVVTSMIVSFLGVSSLVFRSNKSVLDSSIPARFASKRRGVNRSAHEFGVAWLYKSGTHYDVALGIDEENVYLAPRPVWKVRLGKPAYVIPRRQIVSVTLEASAEIITVRGTKIRCEDFVGEVFEESVENVDVKQLIDTDVLYSMMKRRQLRETYDLDRGFTQIRATSLALIAVATTFAVLHEQWLVALGVVTGGLLIVGVLDHALSHLLKGDRALERVVSCTKGELTVAAVVSVLPPSVTASVISFGAHRSDSLLSFVAGASYAVALSMAALLAGLAFMKVKSQVPSSTSSSRR